MSSEPIFQIVVDFVFLSGFWIERAGVGRTALILKRVWVLMLALRNRVFLVYLLVWGALGFEPYAEWRRLPYPRFFSQVKRIQPTDFLFLARTR